MFFFRPNSGSLSQKNHAQGLLGTLRAGSLADILGGFGSNEGQCWVFRTVDQSDPPRDLGFRVTGLKEISDMISYSR